MTTSEALHHAARRYCIEAIEHWHRRYADLSAEKGDRVTTPDGKWKYTNAALDVFPRYNVLGAILSEVEQLDPDQFASLEDAKTTIALAGEVAENWFTRGSIGDDAPQPMLDERQKFVRYVHEATEQELATICPLPYRHVLNMAQQRQLQNEIEPQWGKWYGGVTGRRDIPIHLMVQARYIDDARIATLRSILEKHAILRLYELREYDDSFELDLSLVEFDYNGAEGFWMTAGAPWLIYASHEDSLTIGGNWLVADVQQAWPDWQQLIYRGWDAKGPPVM